jgi:hypothetical protein
VLEAAAGEAHAHVVRKIVVEQQNQIHADI